MSVEKVNKYKEEKANRKEILAKQKKAEKRNKTIAAVAAAVVVLAIVGAIGVTIRNQYVVYQNTRPNYDATAMLVTDMTGILSDAAEDESGEEPETEAGDEAETEAGTEAEAETEQDAEAGTESGQAEN